MTKTKTPKVFISYSHSSPDHKIKVKKLADELLKNGVNVIMDIYDLKHGNDIYKYMQQMGASKKPVDKVLIICDSEYAKKSEDGEKGVGVESQIISAEISGKFEQDKFIPVLFEQDENGKPYLPVYCKPLRYIDMSGEEEYIQGFDELLRTIHGEPLYKKPEIGQKPDFGAGVPIAAASVVESSNEVCKSILNEKNNAVELLEDYFDSFAAKIKNFGFGTASFDKDYNHVIRQIEEFIPLRNEAIKVFSCIARHINDDFIEEIHKLFEKLLPYMEPPTNAGSYSDTDCDVPKFLIHELFLYAVALLINKARFKAVARLMDKHYYFPSARRNEKFLPFIEIRQYIKGFTIRNQRLKLGRANLRADYLMNRCNVFGITFDSIIQTDIILAIKGALSSGPWSGWYPDTYIYSDKYWNYEMLARAESREHFDKIKCLWGIEKPETIVPALNKVNDSLKDRFYHNILSSISYDRWCKKP